jgi:hypothetical protein
MVVLGVAVNQMETPLVNLEELEDTLAAAVLAVLLQISRAAEADHLLLPLLRTLQHQMEHIKVLRHLMETLSQTFLPTTLEKVK